MYVSLYIFMVISVISYLMDDYNVNHVNVNFLALPRMKLSNLVMFYGNNGQIVSVM